MKYFITALACLALCGAARADVSECRLILRPADRLACYDKSFPPAQPDKPKVSGAMTRILDTAADEEARLKKSLQSICTRC